MSFLKFLKQKRSKGFSLVELMVVVGIIGILASIAVPRFQKYYAKARQVEAKNNLSHIYTLELNYHADEDQYADFDWVGNKEWFPGVKECYDDKIGFSLNPCGKARYKYNASAKDGTSLDSDFLGTAQSGVGQGKTGNKIVPGCKYPDIWTVNGAKDIQNTSKAVVKCDGAIDDSNSRKKKSKK